MSHSEDARVAGFTKLSKMRPEELRALFTRSGRVQGGLRGALIGGGLGYLSTDEDDDDSFFPRVAGGALAGGALGAAAGHAQGAHLAQKPFARSVHKDGTEMLHLRTPGTFGNELLYAKYPKPQMTWDPVQGRSVSQDSYKPQTGSALLEALMQSRDIPREYR